MKNYKTILAELRATSNRARELEEQGRKAETHKEATPLFEEARIKRIMAKIFKDNARMSFIESELPKIVEVLNNYTGKPMGEKTTAKMQAEVKAKCNCHVYINSRYGYDAVNITLLGEDGCSRYELGYDDLRLISKWDAEKKEHKRVLIDNKMQHIELEDLELSNRAEYIEEVSDHAKKILEEHAKLVQAYKEFEEKCEAYNEIIPTTMDREYARNFKGYINI